MKRHFALAITLMILCGSTLYGCAAVLVGAGVAGGIAISEDTAKLEVEASFDRAWKIAYNTIKASGSITKFERDSGKIEAVVEDSKVEAKVVPVTSRNMRIEVKSRKNLLPNMDLAMRLVNRINSKF